MGMEQRLSTGIKRREKHLNKIQTPKSAGLAAAQQVRSPLSPTSGRRLGHGGFQQGPGTRAQKTKSDAGGHPD